MLISGTECTRVAQWGSPAKPTQGIALPARQASEFTPIQGVAQGDVLDVEADISP